MSNTQPPYICVETAGTWTPEQQTALKATVAQMLQSAQRSTLRTSSGAPDPSALIVGPRALLAIGGVVLAVLLLHTLFWSFVLPIGSIAA